MPGYLESLTIRLTAGMGQQSEEFRERHARYLRSCQRADGGFAGREGDSDLYYTAFALRGLTILGELHGEVAERAARFLQGRMTSRESVVDFLSLIYAGGLLEQAAGVSVFQETSHDWRTAVAEALQLFRRSDGGYAKGPEGVASSTYHTFLVLLCLQLVDRPIADPAAIVRFLCSQQCDEGGFREIRASKRAGTNPTAAAIAALRILDAMTSEIREKTLDFLCEMQTDEGGLRANTRIPIADLLSTFTGLLTLTDLDARDEIDLAHLKRFVFSLDRPEGGFHGAAWDPAHDVEYSFYGLGCAALLG